MGIYRDAPDEYCGHILKPDWRRADDEWHEMVHTAVCLREPRYDGSCVWHADSGEKTVAELRKERLMPDDVPWEANYVVEHLSGAILRDLDFPDGFSFNGCVLTAAKFRDADLRGVDFSATDLRRVEFSNTNLAKIEFNRADLRGAKFPDANLANTEFRDADLRGAEFPETYLKKAEFHEADLSYAEFSEAYLRGAKFSPPTIEGNSFATSLEDAQFEDGTDLRGVDLSGARLYQTAFREIRINDDTIFGIEDETRFGTACRYEYDPDSTVSINDHTSRLEAAAWTYRRLESLFKENAMNVRARDAHIRKEEAQRAFAAEQLANDGWADEYRLPPDEWLSSLRQYISSSVNWHVHRHGESVQRLLGVSGLLIFLCGIIYAVAGIARSNPQTTYRITVIDLTRPGAALVDLVNGLYFSIITFSTIGYGDFYPISPLSRLLVGIESLAGALFIALLVFVIGRRVAR